MANWQAAPRLTAGGQPCYSDLAIETGLMFRLAFHLPLRQTEGLMASVFELMGMSLATPDHSTLSRRAMTMTSTSKGCRLPDGPVHLLIDSTGLKVFGAGEWLQEKHGVIARRTWRKLHLAVDAQTGMVIASTLTANDMGDPSQVAALLDQVDAGIGSVTADGAYDGAPTYDAVAAHAGDIPVIIPPHVTAVPGATAGYHPSQRERHIAVMAAKGRLGWQEETSYGRRSLVETAMGRYKTIIAPGLRAQPARPTRGGGRRYGVTQSHVARRTAKLRPQSKNGFLRLLGKGNLRPYRHPCNNAPSCSAPSLAILSSQPHSG